MKIHASTTKRAARLGVEFVVEENILRLRHLETGALSSEEFDKPAEALEELERLGDDFEWAVDRPVGIYSGVMAKSYHDRYSKNPHGPGCNDSLDIALRDAITVVDERIGETYVDTKLLRQIGLAHECWVETYAALNTGMQRMNVANRLRGRLRNDAKFKVTIGDKTSRWGIEPRVSKPRPPRRPIQTPTGARA